MSEGDFKTPFGISAGRTAEVDALTIADRRIVLGPRVGELTVDYVRKRLNPKQFNLGYLLAKNVDEVVGRERLLHEVYGWDAATLTQARAKELQHIITTDMHFLREAFGDELGDGKWGAVRTVFNAGYRAVSEL